MPFLSASKKAHRQTAEDILIQIQAEISKNTFNFSRYFPNHPKAKQFRKGSDIWIEDKLSEWIEIKKHHLSPSTLRGYRSSINHHLIPVFGKVYLSDLQTSDIKSWIHQLQCQISNQTINNHLIPLREIYSEAFLDELIDKNPLERIKYLKNDPPEACPFETHEMWEIINACEGQIKNLFKFAFWTGLRTGEYIALQWKDIDLNNKTAFIRHTRNRSGDKKTPKTKSSIRKIELTKPAIQALESQTQYTSEGHIFLNPKTMKPWHDDSPVRKTAWIPALKAANIDYRKPYTTRHTFASMMLSAGMPPMWVVQQMGHTNLSQLISTYGKWIPTSENHLEDKISYLWTRDGHLKKVND